MTTKPVTVTLIAKSEQKGTRVRVVKTDSNNYGAVGHIDEHDKNDRECEWCIDFDDQWRNNHDVWFSTEELSTQCDHTGGVEDTRCELPLGHEGTHLHQVTFGKPESESRGARSVASAGSVPPMFAIGSPAWPGLSKLAEEAGEALQVIGKLMGTGGETAHWDGTDLRQRLTEEVGDTLAACDFVALCNGLDVAQRRAGKFALFCKWHRGHGQDVPESTASAGDGREVSVYDMSNADYEQLENAALAAWRSAYCKWADEADKDDADTEHMTTNTLCPGEAREAYTDGYRSGYLSALESMPAAKPVDDANPGSWYQPGHILPAAKPAESLAAVDACALWAYRIQERTLLRSASMYDLQAHERKLFEHFSGVVAVDPSLAHGIAAAKPVESDELHQARIRAHESRALLQRMVKYVREDRAETPGNTRLARLTDQVADYLQRTHDPRSILRGDAEAAKPVESLAGWIPVGERLPEPEKRVLVRYKVGPYPDTEIAKVQSLSGHWYSSGFPLHEGDVSHWRPIPE